MSFILNDMKYGFRIMSKRPWFSLFTSLALAIGIGLTAVQFSMLNVFLWRGLPSHDSERLYKINWKARNAHWNASLSWEEFEQIRNSTSVFENLGAYSETSLVASYEGMLRSHQAAYVTSNFLDILNVKPVIGRSFEPSDTLQGAQNVALISFENWIGIYNKDSRIVLDKTIQIGNKVYHIAGVLPKGFGFPFNHDLWLPLNADDYTADNSNLWVTGFGKVKPGIKQAQTQAELDIQYQRFKSQNTRNDIEQLILKSSVFTDFLDSPSKMLFVIMFVMALAVLGIACFNVSNLLLGRSLLRCRELSIRSALGATRRRIVCQLLMESMVLAIIGAAGGVLLAVFGQKFLNSILITFKDEAPYWIYMSLDLRSLVWIIIITVGTGLIAGLIPSLRATKPGISDLLKSNNRTGTDLRMGRFAKILVIAQVTGSFVLISFTALSFNMVSDMNKKHFADEPEKIVRTSIIADQKQFPEHQECWNFYQNIEREVSGIQGISAAGFTTRPMRGTRYAQVVAQDRSEDFKLNVLQESVTEGYFKTLGAKVLKGRLFNETDTAQTQLVAVVNPDFLKLFWPDETNPVGKLIRINSDGTPRWVTVVGVVEDLHMDYPLTNSTIGAGIYIPLCQSENIRDAVLVFRAEDNNTHRFDFQVAQIISRYAPQMQIKPFVVMSEWITTIEGPKRLILKIFTLFGIIALILAVIGVLGVTAFSLNRRTKEFAIRTALGARSTDIIKQIIRRETVHVGIGLMLGGIFSFGVIKAFENMVSEPCNAALNAAVGGLCLFCCIGLVIIPVIYRSSRKDPINTLRYE